MRISCPKILISNGRNGAEGDIFHPNDSATHAYKHGIDRPDITEWKYPHPSI
jgi:hypothetical protein